MSVSLLELSGLTKRFGGVLALRGGSLQVRAGEVHGLVGENGAGKSTLINIATGLLRPDAGTVLVRGQAVAFANTHQAADAGIHVVHQEADLFSQLSIAENMLLGRGLVRGRGGLIRWSATYAEADRLVAEMGERFNVREEAGGLAVARRTVAEIAAAVAANPLVLFLDEPTASLTGKEIHNLFGQIRRLSAAGVGIVYVSHRLEEILTICDRVTVMRDGETVATQPVTDLTMDALVAAMVGRELEQMYQRRESTPGAVRLRVQGLTTRDKVVRGVSLEVRAGEIVGLYGFVGAGRTELAQALFGMRPLAGGTVSIDGEAVTIRTPRQAVRAGLAYLPEDRLVQGIFRGHAVRSNGSATILRRLSQLTFVRGGKERDLADKIVRDMKVRTASVEQPIGTLSGGNQQKVVFGRWQATAPRVLMLDEPTRGVDVGAKAEIHKLIGELAAGGAAVLLISSELPEVAGLSDRLLVVSEGQITGEFDPRTSDEATIAAAAVPKAVTQAVVEVAPWRRKLARALELRELGLLLVILLLSGMMSILSPSVFMTRGNILDVLAMAALPAILAQGAMLIICAGGIDISVGSMLGLTGAIAAMAAKSGAPPLVCLALALAVGTSLSLANAGVSLLARIHPIIVTLAGISIYRGLMRVVTGGSEIMLLPAGYRALADGDLFGIPKLCYYLIAVTLLTHLLMRYTLLGRRVLALGNSENAARLIGLSKNRLTLFVFAFSGVLVGLASVLHAGFFGKVQANTGMGMELQAIAAAVIGGTNILGGRGSALGTLLGAFLIALLYNSLVLLEASPYWQSIFVGGLILLAVIIDASVTRLRGATR